jgi:hypothetical protein
MGYKIVIREREIAEGAVEDYYNQVARQKGLAGTFSLAKPPKKVDTKADLQAKLDAQKALIAKRKAAEAEKTAKEKTAADKQAAKQGEEDKLNTVRELLKGLASPTDELIKATGLDTSVLQAALTVLTDKYIIKKAKLTEAPFKATPLKAPPMIGRFSKLYPGTLDPQIFKGFASDEQVINFLYMYEQNLKNVQAEIAKQTGKNLNIEPKLLKAFELNNHYMEQLTGSEQATEKKPRTRKPRAPKTANTQINQTADQQAATQEPQTVTPATIAAPLEPQQVIATTTLAGDQEKNIGDISQEFVEATGPKIWEEFFNGYGGTNRGSAKKLKETFDSNNVVAEVSKHPSLSTLAVVKTGGATYGFPLANGYAGVAEYFDTERANPFSLIINMKKTAVLDPKTLEVVRQGYVEVK